uniref:Uncharacterized protein n=1 Tax=Oryza rufipogon TaxID=4529 RepID=A0A0E0PYY3_ORYRU
MAVARDLASGSQPPHGSGGRPPSPLGIRLPSLLFLSSPNPAEGRGVNSGAAGGERRGLWERGSDGRPPSPRRIRLPSPPLPFLPSPDPVEGRGVGGGAAGGERGGWREGESGHRRRGWERCPRPMTSMAVAAGSGGAAANSRSLGACGPSTTRENWF